MRKEIYHGFDARAVLDIKLYKAGRTHKEYDVELIDGTWPPDDQLVKACEGGDINKGGTVQYGAGEMRFVSVHCR